VFGGFRGAETVAGRAKKTQVKNIGFAREIAALLLIALATLLTLSLISFDAQDDTLLTRNYARTDTRNYIGPVGANISAILFQLAGWSAYILPVTLFFLGSCLALRVQISAPATKAVGVLGLLFSSLVLFSLFFPALEAGGSAHPLPGGGLMGLLLLDSLRGALSDLAIHIVASTVGAVSLLLTVHFSFGKFFQWIWKGLSALFSSVQERRRTRVKLRSRRARKSSAAPRVLVRMRVGWLGRRKERGETEASQPAVPARAVQQYSTGRAVEPEDDEAFRPIIGPHKKRRPKRAARADGRLPPLSLLDEAPVAHSPLNLKMLTEQSRTIVNRYREFGIEGEVLQTNPGPVVNTFEYRPAAGVKYSKVVGLGDELCLALKAVSVRINRLPGKSTIGIEVPNHDREMIYFKEIVESPEFEHSETPLTLALGKLINGDPIIARLDEMPHLLIAGATGTGKSIAINAMICSILYKATPDEVKFILIDPKQVELSCYNGIPHLLTPVVSSPKRAANALRWGCEEMDGRYRRLATEGARNIEQYNRIAAEAQKAYADLDEDDEAAIEPMPYIVIAIDELADLMMISSAEVEESICRLAQKARAVGIHLIIATQRPSVDVLTGVIKANFPCRISFRVASKVDSRTVLDCNGAETLLGDGDMLFLPPRTSRLIRVHGPFISEKETARIVDYLGGREGNGYEEDILETVSEKHADADALAPAMDPLYDEAVRLVLSTGVASISNLQRKMRLGYARAARIIDMMEAEGILGPADGSKPREILKKQMM
jgi:S-DNA-T family DNA segregation ATPase FtsK/SpoIIIE